MPRPRRCCGGPCFLRASFPRFHHPASVRAHQWALAGGAHRTCPPKEIEALLAQFELFDIPFHPVPPKAVVALARVLGYPSAYDVAYLKKQHLGLDVKEVEKTPFGQKYSIEGPLVGLNGRKALLVSVWIIKEGEGVPRFVTAYPA